MIAICCDRSSCKQEVHHFYRTAKQSQNKNNFALHSKCGCIVEADVDSLLACRKLGRKIVLSLSHIDLIRPSTDRMRIGAYAMLEYPSYHVNSESLLRKNAHLRSLTFRYWFPLITNMLCTDTTIRTELRECK